MKKIVFGVTTGGAEREREREIVRKYFRGERLPVSKKFQRRLSGAGRHELEEMNKEHDGGKQASRTQGAQGARASLLPPDSDAAHDVEVGSDINVK